MARERGGAAAQRTARDLLFAAAAAGTLSGIPSTVHAVVTGRNPLDSIRAAATLVPGRDAGSPVHQLATGLAVHGLITLGWTAVLSVAIPRRNAVAWGAVAGLGIAALDLGLVGRRYPAIAALPTSGQVADHVAFGAIVGLVLSRAARRSARVRPRRDR